MYIRMMYDRTLYGRWQPEHAPLWFQELSVEDQRLEETKLQLARAAFAKLMNGGQADKIIETEQDAMLFVEQMKSLYELPGVKPAMEWYVQKMINGEEIIIGEEQVRNRDGTLRTNPDGTPQMKPVTKSWWDIGDNTEFEQMRQVMRRERLADIGRSDDVDDLEKMERDAIALNFLYVCHVAESLDSRYSTFKGSGERHPSLPGILLSDDLRALMHPQEKAESKWQSGQPWDGNLGPWCQQQFSHIKDDLNPKEKFQIAIASGPGEFWTIDRSGGATRIRVPECYPTTSVKSFLEETVIEQPDGSDKMLLQYLTNGEEIPWREIGASEPWSISYGTVKLPKALKLLDTFQDAKLAVDLRDLREGLRKWANADPKVNEVFTRLGFRKRNGSPISKEQFHNLKVWAIYAGLGGMREVGRKTPSLRLDMGQRAILVRLLQQSYVGYLDRGEDFEFNKSSILSRLFK